MVRQLTDPGNHVPLGHGLGACRRRRHPIRLTSLKSRSWATCTIRRFVHARDGGGVTVNSAPYGQGTPAYPGSSGSVGTPQYNAKVGITAEGSFTVTYLQDNLDAAGNVDVHRSIYYRVYDESTDTAGPIVTDTTLVSTSGETANLNVSPAATLQQRRQLRRRQRLRSVVQQPDQERQRRQQSGQLRFVRFDRQSDQRRRFRPSISGLDEAANLAQMAVDNPTLYGTVFGPQLDAERQI